MTCQGAAAGGRPGRVVGIDLGSRRIGVAVSDSARTLAMPRTTVVRSGDPSVTGGRWWPWCSRRGRPRWWSVTRSPWTGAGVGPAGAAEAEVDALRALLDGHAVVVELFDERLTTVTAHQALRAGGTSGKASRKVIDRAAAAVLLQAWLDGQRRARVTTGPEGHLPAAGGRRTRVGPGGSAGRAEARLRGRAGQGCRPPVARYRPPVARHRPPAVRNRPPAVRASVHPRGIR